MKSYDLRSTEYVEKTNLDPNTHKGDIETCYVIACIEQREIDVKNIKQTLVDFAKQIQVHYNHDKTIQQNVDDFLKSRNL